MTDKPRIAVVAPGEMGAGVGARLTQRGAAVVTLLEGRSETTVQRANAAGMEGVALEDLGTVDFILSIVPPGEAVALAQRLAPVLSRASGRPIYVDCNAVSPATAERLAAIVGATGTRFVDAGIIGGPPQSSGRTPTIYASGPDAAQLGILQAHGLVIEVMDGPVGQASAIKMSYGALTKGLQAVGISAMLGAIDAGIAEPFRKELERSQTEILAHFGENTGRVFSRAYRWVAEMEEIGAFLGGGGEQLFNGAARQFDRLAKDQKAGGADAAAIMALIRGEP